MEVFQHPFLEAPLKNLSELYYNQVVPRLTTKNKVIAITTAIFLVVSYKISNKIMPPRSLRHIPHQAYFSYFISLISREPVLKRQQRFGLPVINSKENNGLYLVR
jgi:hypothetical protein